MIDIHIDNINCKAIGLANYPRIQKCLQAYAPGYQYTYKYKRLGWDGKISLFDGESFPTGLLPLVLEQIQKYNFPVTLSDDRNIPGITLKSSPVALRPYQEAAVSSALSNTYLGTWWPRGVIQIATGGGKTEIAADIILKTNVPTIFLVHRRDLESQTVQRFNKYGIKTGGLDTIDKNHVTVVTVQTLMSCITNFEKFYINSEGKKTERSDDWMTKKDGSQSAKEAKIKASLLRMQQVFIDEAHLVAAKLETSTLFGKALAWMPNAYMRWGLTATPFMRDKLHNWMLEGSTGPAIVSISNRELIDQGFLSEATVDIFDMGQDAGIPKGWPDCYDFGVVTHRSRNMKIIECLKSYPGPVLILVSKIGHGELLESMASKAGIDIPFLSGRSSQKERMDTLDKLSNSKLRGAIVSTIWDEGINCPAIRTIILAGAGKSEIKNLQRLGRGLRTAPGKSTLKLVDFMDRSPQTLLRHSNERYKFWKEQGFEINIIKV